MNNKVLNFELTTKDLKIKELLKGDFLNLEMLAISDANPNMNMSHFTVESMQNALDTFKNKPILGAFNSAKGISGDFEGHNDNGLHWDPELEEMYFDYSSKDSERILGMIRESDDVSIIEKDGLKWIKFTCCLWCSYAYKAIKSLLRARNGKSSISVEVEVTKSHVDENGIEQIEEFNFLGCTILGQDVVPGITGANLSVLDFMKNANYSKKQKCLAFAYSALDDYNSNKVNNPEKDFNKINKSKGEDPVVNEDPTQEITMIEKGGEPIMLTNNAKRDLLQAALDQFIKENCSENECCWGYVCDLDMIYCYYNFNDMTYRAPYQISEAEEQNIVVIDFNQAERVVPAWQKFESDKQEEKEVEACGDKAEEACGDKTEEACGDKEAEACGDKEEFEHGEEGEGHKCIECAIRDLIIDEEEAIQGYSHAEKHFEEEYPLIAKIFHELKEEEEKHIGELQVALQMVNDESQEHIEEGMAEANEIVLEEILEDKEEAEEEKTGAMVFAGPAGDSGIGDSDEVKDGIEDDGVGEDDNPDNDPDKKPEDKDDEPDDKAEPDNDAGDVKEKETEACGKLAEEGCFEEENPEVNDPEDSDDKKDEDPEESEDDDEEDDKDEDDDKEDDDDDEEDKDDDEEEKPEDPELFAADAKGEEVNPNSEPDPTRLPDTVEAGIEDSTASIHAPEVQLEIVSDGTVVNSDVSKGPMGEEAFRPEEGTEVEDDVKQPDDKAKEFSADVDVTELMKKYAALQEQFDTLSQSVKAQEALTLAEFGKNFINEEDIIPEEVRNEYAAQVADKCINFEFTTEEEVVKFAKSLLAMYYYENRVTIKEREKEREFNVNLQKQTVANSQVSNAKLKDAINKLNHTN